MGVLIEYYFVVFHLKTTCLNCKASHSSLFSKEAENATKLYYHVNFSLLNHSENVFLLRAYCDYVLSFFLIY